MLICDIKHYIYGEFPNWLSFDLLGITNPILKSVSTYYVPGPVLDRDDREEIKIDHYSGF